MNLVRTISILAAIAATPMATSVWAISDEQHDSHQTAATATIQVGRAALATPRRASPWVAPPRCQALQTQWHAGAEGES